MRAKAVYLLLLLSFGLLVSLASAASIFKSNFTLKNAANSGPMVQEVKTVTQGVLSDNITTTPATGCTAPSAGCGTNYYWDSNSCTCVYYQSQTCTAPSSGCEANYYWDSGSCSCRQSTSCTPPAAGCGSNYYWDTSTCSCRNMTVTPTTYTTVCTAPAGGCGSNYYWDTYYCTCKPYANSCISPSYGCGSNYYWDTGSCSCRSYSLTPAPGTSTSGTCTAPAAGCGYNYYWDSYSCSCKYYQASTSTCSAPAAGCGTNYYWDSGACLCKASPTCYPPSSGCSSSSYWDSGSCSCKAYTTTANTYCNVPSGGCGYNYYWDSYSCSCKSSQSYCTAPSSGCPANYYWDYADCSCKVTNQGTASACVAPPAGCGYGYYWDTAGCICKLSPSVTLCPNPSAGCGTSGYWDANTCSCKTYYPYYSQQNFDRFAYEPTDRISCIKGFLSQYEFDRLRFLVPTNQTEQTEIMRLGEKTKSCWSSSGGTQVNLSVTATLAQNPLENESCLIKKLGEKSYREIYQGLRKPSYEEHLLYEQCFGAVNVSKVTYQTSEEKLSKETESCLRTVLSGGLYDRVKNGKDEVPYEYREKVNRCFGINPQPFEEVRTYTVPDEVKNCLNQAVGDLRFKEVSSGKSQPTEAERKKGEACFAKLNQDQTKFLPLPPEQLPFIDSAPEVIQVTHVKQQSKKVKDKSLGGKVNFAGKALPQSTVTIYIFSEPIVVTTKTDENGEWVYELDQPVGGEDHIAYATVRDETGRMVKSSIFNFTVRAAEEDVETVRYLQEKDETVDLERRFFLIAMAIIAVAGVLTFAFLSFRLYKKMGGKTEPKTESKRDKPKTTLKN